MPTNRQRLITVCYLPVCSPLSCFLCCAVIIILYLCTYSVRHNGLHDHNNYNSLITCNYFHLLFETFRIGRRRACVITSQRMFDDVANVPFQRLEPKNKSPQAHRRANKPSSSSNKLATTHFILITVTIT